MRSITVSKLLIFVIAAVILVQYAAAPSSMLVSSCNDCHGKLILSSHNEQLFIEKRKMHLELGVSCTFACHEDRLNRSTADTFGMWTKSSHALFNGTCENCHNGNTKAVSEEGAHLGLSNTSVICNSTHETCGKCHRQELDDFLNSEHRKKQVEEENTPTCLTCHQTHSDRPLTLLEREDICTNCHVSFNETCKKCHEKASASKEAHLSISNISIVRQESFETCGKCHEAELSEFKSSPLLKKLESSGELAPTCVMCHNTHTMRISPKVEDFCTNCHNNLTGEALDSGVLEKTEKTLSSINELKVEISKAKAAVASAKAESKSVAKAESDLESAKAILKNISSHWHRFNLTLLEICESEALRGIAKAQEAEKAVESLPQRAPGFEALLLVYCMIAAYFLKVRKS